MKRFVAFLFILTVFALIPLGMTSFSADTDEVTRATFVTESPIEMEGAEVIASGVDYYITVSAAQIEEAQSKLKNIKGYVCYYDKSVNENKINSLLQYKLSETIIENTRVLTGYTSAYKDYRIIDGKKVNIQVAFTESEVIVGYPLILTGF